MKITPQSVRCRGSRACRAEGRRGDRRWVGCNPLGNQQNEAKLATVSVFRTCLIRANSCLPRRRYAKAGDSWALRFFGSAPNASPPRTGHALPTLIFLSLSLLCTVSFAQISDNVAEREVQRRKAGISQGEAALARGQAAMKAK